MRRRRRRSLSLKWEVCPDDDRPINSDLTSFHDRRTNRRRRRRRLEIRRSRQQIKSWKKKTRLLRRLQLGFLPEFSTMPMLQFPFPGRIRHCLAKTIGQLIIAVKQSCSKATTHVGAISRDHASIKRSSSSHAAAAQSQYLIWKESFREK